MKHVKLNKFANFRNFVAIFDKKLKKLLYIKELQAIGGDEESRTPV